MRKLSTPEYRSSVLQILDKNRGSISRTSQETGVPERTLYTWRRNHKLPPTQPQSWQQPSFPSPPPTEDEEDADEIDLLRKRLMRNALSIADSLDLNLDSGSLNARVKALKTLMDSIMELDSNYVEEDSGPRTIQIEYVDAVGKIYQAPPWATDDGEDDDELEEDA